MNSTRKNISLENPVSARTGRLAYLSLDSSQGFFIYQNQIGAIMKRTKKTSVKKGLKNPSKKRKSKTKISYEVNQIKQSIDSNVEQSNPSYNETAQLRKRINEIQAKFDFQDKIRKNFGEVESQYLNEISELFSLYPEYNSGQNMFNSECEISRPLQSFEIPVFRVFFLEELKYVGKEKVLGEGCFEIEELLISATVSISRYFSNDGELDKAEKLFKKTAKHSYEETIMNYAYFDYSFKKLLNTMNIQTEDTLK